MNPKNDDLAVVVLSCDKYGDVWNPFFTLFFRYWPDCPFDIFLVTNFLSYNDPRVKTISVGEDVDWSTNVRAALQKIPHRYLMILMEDYLLTTQVDTVAIGRLLDYMRNHQTGYLRLFPSPGPARVTDMVDDLEIGVIEPGEPYRVSLQAAIWDKQIVEELIVIGESAWDFEIQGTERSSRLNSPFLSIARSAFDRLPFSYFCTGVVKGYWLREAVDLCRRQGIIIDTRARPVEPWHVRWSRKFKQK